MDIMTTHNDYIIHMLSWYIQIKRIRFSELTMKNTQNTQKYTVCNKSSFFFYERCI